MSWYIKYAGRGEALRDAIKKNLDAYSNMIPAEKTSQNLVFELIEHEIKNAPESLLVIEASGSRIEPLAIGRAFTSVSLKIETLPEV